MLDLAKRLYELFNSKGLTLATAESCTGGAISSLLTKAPGASDYFLGSIVSYTIPVKTGVLQVHSQTIERFGVVSEEVALEMAKGAQNLLSSDIALSVTGIAGPSGGTDKIPVGTVVIAITSSTLPPLTHVFHFKGDRVKVIEQTVSESLNHLISYISV